MGDTRRGLKFDGTIHLGHVVQIVVLIGTLIAFYTSIDKRVAIVEMSIASADNERTEMHDDIKVMTRSINDLAVSQERLNTILVKAWE